MSGWDVSSTPKWGPEDGPEETQAFPGQGRRQVQTIRTERRATSVEAVGCTAPGQDDPR